MEMIDLTNGLISVAVILIVWGISLYAKVAGKNPSTLILQWVVYGFAFFIALAAEPVTMPVWVEGASAADVVENAFMWLKLATAQVAPIFTAATLFYTTIMKKVFEKLTG